MEQVKKYTKNKGGRPQKAVKKDQLLAIKCTMVQRKTIEAKAKMANITVSDFLRQSGLSGENDTRKKSFPKGSFTAHRNNQSPCSQPQSNRQKKKRNGATRRL